MSVRRLDEVALNFVTGVGSVNTMVRVAYSVVAGSRPHSSASVPCVAHTCGTPACGPVTETVSDVGRSSSADPIRSAAASAAGFCGLGAAASDVVGELGADDVAGEEVASAALQPAVS